MSKTEQSAHKLDRRLSVAPMMDWTTSHHRNFIRLLSHHILLYTEMVTTGAIIHGDRDRFLSFQSAEQPIALQLGGSDPKELAKCARFGEDYGYDEINLNCGCPSDRVQSGRFGACLMAEPELVAECISTMQSSITIPVTVKTRLGIDDRDSYAELSHFIQTIAATGCKTFILHARKAWLNGLSPKENREIPPLCYDTVHHIKRDFPQLEIIINGGIKTLAQCNEQLQGIDGVMIGREAWHNPYMLAQADQQIYGDDRSVDSREKIVDKLLPYIQEQLGNGIYLNHLTRPILGLYLGQPGARLWRRILSEGSCKKEAGIEVIEQALKTVTQIAARQVENAG